MMTVVVGLASSAHSTPQRPARTVDLSLARATFTLTSASPFVEVHQAFPGSTTRLRNAVHAPGACCVVGDPTTPSVEYLISGRDARGHGILQFLSGRDTTVSLRGVVDFGVSRDLCGVAHVENTLFALDCETRQILATEYTAGDPLPKPRAWTVVATEDSIPQLADAARYRLEVAAVPSEVIELALVQVGCVIPERVRFRLNGDGPSVESVTPGSNRFSALETLTIVPGATSIPAHGPAGASVELLATAPDGGVTTVATAQCDAAGHATLTIPDGLAMDRLYRVRTADVDVASGGIVPVKRWADGKPMTTFNGHQMLPWGNVGVAASVGNGDFYLTLRTVPVDRSAVTAPASFRCILKLGIEGVHGIVSTPQGPLVDTPQFVEDSIDYLDTDHSAVAVGWLPIPADPDLVGTVLLAQWIMTDESGTDAFLSDIVGIRIRDDERGGALSRTRHGSAAEWLRDATRRMREPERRRLRAQLRARD